MNFQRAKMNDHALEDMNCRSSRKSSLKDVIFSVLFRKVLCLININDTPLVTQSMKATQAYLLTLYLISSYSRTRMNSGNHEEISREPCVIQGSFPISLPFPIFHFYKKKIIKNVLK